MAQNETIETYTVKGEGGKKYFLSIFASMEEETGEIEVLLRLAGHEFSKKPLEVKLKAKITNPLEIIAVYLLHAVAHYGLCMGTALLYSGGEMCFLSYKESQGDFPEIPVSDRCRDVFRRLKGQSHVVRDGAEKALKECALHAIVGAAVGGGVHG